jgi:hypothetical protein
LKEITKLNLYTPSEKKGREKWGYHEAPFIPLEAIKHYPLPLPSR